VRRRVRDVLGVKAGITARPGMFRATFAALLVVVPL
jgi:hypothetical protein